MAHLLSAENVRTTRRDCPKSQVRPSLYAAFHNLPFCLVCFGRDSRACYAYAASRTFRKIHRRGKRVLNVARSKTVVAIAASLMTVALIGGTAVAARLITSADIKDETIRARDLKPSLVDRINRRGPRGRAGAPGFMPTRITASDTGPTQTWDAWFDACGATQGEIAFVNGVDQTPPLGTGAF